MEMRKLDTKVLKLWYIKAVLGVLILSGVLYVACVIVKAFDPTDQVFFGIAAVIALFGALIAAYSLIIPYFRFKMYSWGYDEQRIIVKQGVVFQHRVVIPICQIQDLHRYQGPLMMALHLSNVTISTAGSNFDISTLTTEEADRLIDALEQNLEKRIEELRDEEI